MTLTSMRAGHECGLTVETEVDREILRWFITHSVYQDLLLNETMAFRMNISDKQNTKIKTVKRLDNLFYIFNIQKQ